MSDLRGLRDPEGLAYTSMDVEQLTRVRGLCLALPETSERLSHGEPTFFVHKKVFVMFANNHHGDGRLAVWLPAPPGAQETLIAQSPTTYFKPPYVGGRGWVGIELAHVSDADLSFHIQVAWELTAPKRLLASKPASSGQVARILRVDDQTEEPYMNVHKQIKDYIAAQPKPKQSDMQELHGIILGLMPDCKLWFLDGKDERGHTVSNPNIGYGLQTTKHADGKIREFYQIGMSANTTGISIYVMGIKDKKYLAATYGKKLGQASVTGYCIKFRTLRNINVDILEAALRYGIEQTSS